MSSPVHLGPFQLQRALASGGMGTVYRAVHTDTGTLAAVKVVLVDKTDEQRFIADSLAAEVRAVASMSHPGIVAIYDQGEVDDVAAARSDDLVQGTPWLAMQLLDGGSLRSRSRAMSAEELVDVLLALLDALAHAHARGVLHLDVKPANVLFAQGDDQPRLTDFGMGLVGQPDPTMPWVRGTPHYMAPEQVRGRWDQLGPWTDLYALGCLAWRCACGTSWIPDRATLSEVLEHQRAVEPPERFEPRMGLPDGFEGWLRALLHKDPDERFRCAADAAYALRRVTGLPEANRVEWRLPERALPALEPGIGLVGVRPPPLIGRTRERDLLWSALLEAATGPPRAVVVRGPIGSGKTRLARWVGERAHELGLAVPLHAVHAADPSPGTGLIGMVRRWMQADPGADGIEDELHERLRRRGLDVAEARDAASLLVHGETPAAWAEVLGVPQWWEVVADLVRAAAAERTPVCVVDDAHLGAPALEALAWMWRAQRVPPSLWVVVAEEEGLRADPDAEQHLEALEAMPGVQTLVLGPLSEQASSALSRRLLPLEPALAARVAQRSGGNPLYAVELVSDWVDRGVLVPGASGYRLRPGAEVPPPEALEALWSEHLEAVLHAHPEWWPPLEVAAVLGLDVDQVEWGAACSLLGLDRPRELLLALLDARLARLEPLTRGKRWSFVHPMLRDAVTARAASEGRAEAIHRACAEVVGDRDPERLGLHRLLGGQPGEALQPLLEAVHLRRLGDVGHRERLLETVEIVATTELHPDDARWAALWGERTTVLLERGLPAEARTYAERQLLVASRGAWTRDALAAHLDLSEIALELGEHEAALEHAEDAETLAERDGNPALVSRAWCLRAEVLRVLGRLDEARHTLEWATLLALPPHCAEEREVFHEAGRLALAQGRLHASRRYLRHVAFSAEVSGDRGWMARASLGLGDVHRALGDAEGALVHYQVARRRLHALGHGDEVLAHLGLVHALLDRDRGDDAEKILEQVRDRVHTPRHQLRLLLAEVALRATRAFDPGWPDHWRRARRLLDEVGRGEPSVARLLIDTAELAVRPERARELREAARRLVG